MRVLDEMRAVEHGITISVTLLPLLKRETDIDRLFST